jgi:hypothetical protein
MLSALKKMAMHGVKWHFATRFNLALNLAQLSCIAQLPTFSAEMSQASSLDAHALKKAAIHGVKWHFSGLLHKVRTFFH